MARTRKPCPGCKEVSQRRKTDEVCWQCQALLKEAIAARRAQETDKLREVVQLPCSYYSLPYIAHLTTAETIQKTFKSIAEIIAEPAPHLYRHDAPRLVKDLKDSYGKEQTHLMPKGAMKLFGDLYSAILSATDEAYAEGLSDGSNLLLELSKGKVSVEDFNERVSRHDRKSKSRHRRD